MQQDWLVSTLTFIRLNLGIIFISLGLFIVLVWGGITYLNSQKTSQVAQTETQDQISATATILPTIDPAAPEAPGEPLVPSAPVATFSAKPAPTAPAATSSTRPRPTSTPSIKPTPSPTPKPVLTQVPTPTPILSATPSAKPTIRPTAIPTPKPTATPIITPKPTIAPTATPSAKPIASPAPRALTKGGLPIEGTLDDLPAKTSQKGGTYTVQKGDSTWKVAQKFYGNGYQYVEIEKANKLKHNQYLEIGQVLVIPDKQAAEAPKTGVSQVEKGVVTDNTQAPTTSGKTYVVKAGDSLWAIASAQLGNAYRWSEIYRLNKQVVGSDPGLIYPGQTLQLPQSTSSSLNPGK